MVQLTVATLNTRGMPLRSQLSARYAAIGALFEASDVDVVNFQEVLTYYHLRQLLQAMPSYRHASYRRSLAGPAGGLLTLSRTALASPEYRRFPLPPAAHAVGLPRLSRRLAHLKGVLLTRLPQLTIANTHLLANRDGDWSEANRYYRLHQDQLAALAQVLAALNQPTIVSGDFNIARTSPLFTSFLHTTGLLDPFAPSCPPTFHASYLSPHQTPHCIDFLLATPPVTATATRLTFT
ncbi:endonuclease/exonuclease/phosphatase family protein, partial [Kribbella antibiotica]